MKNIVQKIIVAGIVLHEGKVLIIQRAEDDESFPGLWEIPSGKREQLEKTKDAVIREVMEETGLSVTVGRPFDVFEFKVEKPDEIRDATQICFIVSPVGATEVKLSSEHQNSAWITESEIDDYSLSKEMKIILREVFKS